MDRGLSLSCTYTRHPSTLATAADPRAAGNVHDRIDQLEKLVTTLMAAKRKDAQSADGQSNPSIFSPPALSYSPKLSDGAGNGDIPIAGLPDRVELDDDETRYTNSGHWTSILDGVSISRFGYSLTAHSLVIRLPNSKTHSIRSPQPRKARVLPMTGPDRISSLVTVKE